MLVAGDGEPMEGRREAASPLAGDPSQTPGAAAPCQASER